jgi:flagellar hook-associated protein 1 FlgK
MVVSLFSMLSLGSNALQTQQILLDIAGQNVANASTEGYTRQRADILQYQSVRIGGLLFGVGSRVDTIARIRESLLDDRFRRENSVMGEYSIRMDYLSQIENILAEPSQEGIAQALANFFDSFEELTNNPEDEGVRTTVSKSGVALADSINMTYELLNNLRTTTNDFIRTTVDEVNTLAAEISELNRQITGLEAGSGTANAALDSRDLLLNQLSELASVEIRRSDNGTASVYLDGYGLVQDFSYNPIGLRLTSDIDPTRGDFYEVVAAGGGNRPLNVRSGNLRGYLDIRDGVTTNQILSDLDTLALEVIEEVNRIHSQGQGLVRYDSLTSDYAVSDADTALTGADLPFTPQDGSFFLAVYDSQGRLTEQREITIDADTDTLNTVAAQINAAFASGGRLTATVTADNRLLVETATPGDTFSFVGDGAQEGDTSDFLLSMGINSFFTFDSEAGAAASMAVSDAIQNDVALIAAGRSTGPGDNSNALALAQLRNTPLLGASATATLEEFFQATLTTLGYTTQLATDRQEIQTGVVDGIANMRDAIAGVWLDEEGVNIIRAQQAYEASARFISAVSDVLDILLEQVG